MKRIFDFWNKETPRKQTWGKVIVSFIVLMGAGWRVGTAVPLNPLWNAIVGTVVVLCVTYILLK